MPPLVLPETCDRAAARALYPDISDALGPSALTIDASKVTRIGQAMLQVLVAAQKTEGGIAVIATSSEFDAALALTGLGETLAEDAAR